MYGTVASLRQTPEANITLYVNDTTIIKLKKKILSREKLYWTFQAKCNFQKRSVEKEEG